MNNSQEPTGAHYPVTVHLTKEQFRDFISDVFGQPERIGGGRRGYFEISVHDICHVFHAVRQRIDQQNEITLSSFSVTLMYDDGSTINFNDIEHFRIYNEVRKVTTIGIHLSWNLLIKFQNKPQPEKQEINISFITGSHSDINSLNVDTGLVFETILFPFVSQGHVNYSIQHTARTWGADIQGLLTNCIDGLIQKPSWLASFVTSNRKIIGSLVGYAILMATIAVSFFTSTQYISVRKAELLAKNVVTNDQMLQFIVANLVEGAWHKFYFVTYAFLLLMFGISLSVRNLIQRKGLIAKPGIFLITKTDESQKQEKLKRQRKTWVDYALSIVGGVLVGIVSNVLFAYMWKN